MATAGWTGPKERRPRRSELAWYAEESNRFGTDEFIAYCRELGAEPIICVNMGSGTMDEAQAWVEYCNGTGNTSWAGLRRAHGHPEPHRVRYWGLGNEMYGGWQISSLEARDYVKKARVRDGDEAHRSVHPARRLRAERRPKVARHTPLGEPSRRRGEQSGDPGERERATLSVRPRAPHSRRCLAPAAC